MEGLKNLALFEYHGLGMIAYNYAVYAALLQEDLEVNHKPLFFISMMV